MRRPTPIPPTLIGRAFTREEAAAAGISPRMLEHPRFTRVHQGLYVVSGTALPPLERLRAAMVATAQDAVVSHHTRFLPLGLDIGDATLHFTTGLDKHLQITGVALHRTRFELSSADRLIDIELAVIGAAKTLSFIDLVATMDWLAHRRHLDLGTLDRRLAAEPRRPGARTVRRALAYVEPRSRSIPESQVRVLMVLAGLDRPASNLDVHDGRGRFLFCGDLVLLWLKLAIEYEGRQHELDPSQFRRDIERYARARADGWDYVQVTAAKLARPRACVLEIHAAMVRRGYTGPRPTFGAAWQRAQHRPDR